MQQLLARDAVSDDKVFATVREILAAVRNNGDQALLDYSRRFDQLEVATVGELEMSAQRLQQAFESITSAERDALSQAALRIRAFAERQKLESFEYTAQASLRRYL